MGFSNDIPAMTLSYPVLFIIEMGFSKENLCAGKKMGRNVPFE
jgi:hypothetical protein